MVVQGDLMPCSQVPNDRRRGYKFENKTKGDICSLHKNTGMCIFGEGEKGEIWDSREM